jgi:alkylation response protein AidB-like acyl-CoA dehydrogenase
MFGLFRTEPDASKHAGISYLLIDMKAPGITVAPMKQMGGGADFNQVFFDDVRTPAANIVGKRGEGWMVSRSTLKYERNIIGNPNMMRERFQALVDLARSTTRSGRPAIEDPGVRQQLALIQGYVRSSETSNLRTLTAEVRDDPMSVAMLTMSMKLYATDIGQLITRLAYDLTGSNGLLAPTPEEVESFSFEPTPTGWVKQYMFAIANTLGGGSSNIQRNIIGERGLGLPRDLRPKK